MRRLAQRLGVTVEEIVTLAVRDHLSDHRVRRPAALSRVVEEAAELLDRLSR